MVCCTWSHVAVVREFAWSSSSSPPPPAAGACTSARMQRAQLSRSKRARTKNPHLRFGWRRREYAGKAARHTSSATRERAVVAAVGCMDRRRGAEGFLYRRSRAYFALPLMVVTRVISPNSRNSWSRTRSYKPSHGCTPSWQQPRPLPLSW